LQEFEIIIVGAGPAGLSAGIYVARQNVSCLIISKDLGGQMNLIPRLENYPGAIMTSGQILAKTLETQYLSFKGEIVYDTIEKIDEFEGGFKIKTTRSEYRSKSVVLAPGKVPNMLGIENESEYFNKGIHYCTKCDAPFYQGRTTASVGVGSYLLESGLLLSRMASKMYLILKGSRLAGDKDLVAAVVNNKNIEIVTQSSVKAISGNSVLQQITIVDSSGAEKILDVDALFIEMGSKINLDYVKHLVKINTKGEIEIESGGMTSHPAIFAAGDATTIPYKQIIVACGDGSNAGLSAFNYLEDKPKSPKGTNWDKAIAYWSKLNSDSGAKFDKEVEIRGDDISPMVTWGTSPQDVITVTGIVPDPADEKDEDRKASMNRSLNYMGLKPNTKIIDIKIDRIFIGSCTNGRIGDLEMQPK